MFDNNNKVFAYKISLQLDQHLVALFNLCYDINVRIENFELNNDEILYATQLFKSDFYTLLELDKDEFTSKTDADNFIYSKDEFFQNIAAQLNVYYLKSDLFTDKLSSKEFFYYFKDSNLIYTTINNQKELTNNLNNKFKSLNIISSLIDNIQSDNLRNAISGISTIYDFDKSGQFVKVSCDLLKPQIFKVPLNLVDDKITTEDIFDVDNFWINLKTEYTKVINFDLQKDDIFLLKDETSKVIGLKIKDYILLKYEIDFRKYIKEEFKNQYLWMFLKENIFRERTSNSSHKSKMICEFKAKSKNSDFNKLLSNLKQNLYIDRNINIPSDYKSFFEEFILIKGLDELTNLNFFLPDEKDNCDMIGIYAEKKIGEKYNLLHHIKHKDEKSIIKYINSNPQNEEKIKVNILKAELSFYLVEKYFEDIIEDLLHDINVDFISNVELCIKGKSKAEYDFVIFKDEKFFVIEAKTTLSLDNVYKTLKKFNESIKLLKQITNNNLENFRFNLLGLLSNPNVDNYKHFFIDENYNVERMDYNVVPYKFNVPFFNHQDLELECISEPEISKLNDYIKNLCQI